MHMVHIMFDAYETGVQTWGDAHAGLLLSERLVNAPPQLAPPLNQALFDELEWAQEDEPTQVSCSSRCNCYRCRPEYSCNDGAGAQG